MKTLGRRNQNIQRQEEKREGWCEGRIAEPLYPLRHSCDSAERREGGKTAGNFQTFFPFDPVVPHREISRVLHSIIASGPADWMNGKKKVQTNHQSHLECWRPNDTHYVTTIKISFLYSSHYASLTAYHLNLVDNYFRQLDSRYSHKVFVWSNVIGMNALYFKSNLIKDQPFNWFNWTERVTGIKLPNAIGRHPSMADKSAARP